MTTSPASIVAFLGAGALGALGQYLYKSGVDQAGSAPLSWLAHPRILGGVACHIAVLALFLVGFSKGGALHVLYPLYATTFIWGAVIARWAYGTAILPVHLLGMGLLLAGMVLMGRS